MNANAYFLAALAIGVVAGIYLPLNGRFAGQLSSPLLATAVFFSVGAATALLAWVVFGDGGAVEKLRRAEAPLFGLGAISFGIILGATFFIPRMGPGAYFVCIVAGQVGAGLVLSHLGVLSPERIPLTPVRIAGAALLIAGVLLVRWSETPAAMVGKKPAGSIEARAKMTVRR